MGRDKASELPLLQCEPARGAAAKLPAATTDKTANTSVNRFIGNDPTFFFRFADAPLSAPATVAPWTFVRVRSFTEKAQIAYSHGHPPLSGWVVARRRDPERVRSLTKTDKAARQQMMLTWRTDAKASRDSRFSLVLRRTINLSNEGDATK